MSIRQLKITKSITNRESQSLNKYLQEIKKAEVVTPEEEVTLAIEIKKGSQKALERLVKANLRFVVSVAKQYQNQGITLADLINEGNLGLVKAAQRYDETKGFKFISYAIWWIRQSIMQAISEKSRIVRLPFSVAGITSRITKAQQLLEQKLQRDPSAEELADHLKISAEEVMTNLIITTRHISVDSPLTESEDDNTLVDVLINKHACNTDEKLVYDESLKMQVAYSLQTLSEMQKNVVCFFYGIGIDYPLSLEEIGKKYSLTRERVRQIKEQAMTKLRSTPTYKKLQVYLG